MTTITFTQTDKCSSCDTHRTGRTFITETYTGKKTIKCNQHINGVQLAAIDYSVAQRTRLERIRNNAITMLESGTREKARWLTILKACNNEIALCDF